MSFGFLGRLGLRKLILVARDVQTKERAWRVRSKLSSFGFLGLRHRKLMSVPGYVQTKGGAWKVRAQLRPFVVLELKTRGPDGSPSDVQTKGGTWKVRAQLRSFGFCRHLIHKKLMSVPGGSKMWRGQSRAPLSGSLSR